MPINGLCTEDDLANYKNSKRFGNKNQRKDCKNFSNCNREDEEDDNEGVKERLELN